MIDIDIRDYYNPEENIIDVKETGNVFYDGFLFKINGSTMFLFYNDEKIEQVRLKNKDKSIKNKDEFQRLVRAAEKVFGDMGPREGVMHDFINAVELFIIEDLSSANTDYEYEAKSLKERLIEKPKNAALLTELAGIMQNDFHIIRTDEGIHYYFNEDFGYYTQIDENLYGYLVQQRIGVNLPLQACKDSLSSIIGMEEDNVNLWEFANNYYLVAVSPKNYNVVQKEGPQLTSRKFMHNKELLHYNPNVKLDNGANATLIEKTLKELLIPRQDPSNDKTYKDVLYLIGESFILGNVSKNLIILYNPFGNNGKTLFSHILSLLTGKAYQGIEPDTFDDPFYRTLIDNYNIILIDEVLPDSLKKHYHKLKNITKGGNNAQGLRKMYKDQYFDGKGNGVFFILCNELLDVDLNDEAFLHRCLIYDLPNRFIQNADENANEYEINLDIFDEISEDRAGLEWLANIAIKMYKEYDFKRQNTKEVKDKFISENVIRRFIVDETQLFNKPDNLTDFQYKEEVLSTVDIKEILVDRYPYLLNWEGTKLVRRIGVEVSRWYGTDIKRISDKPTTYNLKYVKKSGVLKKVS